MNTHPFELSPTTFKSVVYILTNALDEIEILKRSLKMIAELWQGSNDKLLKEVIDDFNSTNTKRGNIKINYSVDDKGYMVFLEDHDLYAAAILLANIHLQ